MTTVVVVAVAAELRAVEAALRAPVADRVGPYRAVTSGNVTVLAGGVGPAAAAAAAATAVALRPVELLVSLGVCGAFPAARLHAGDVALATTIVSADLGAQSPERFLDLSALGLDDGATMTADLGRVADLRDRLTGAGLHVALGPLLTLSTATGTADRASELMAAHGAIAEAMEGAGVAHVATLYDLPVLEVRTVSNLVGDRDTSAWDLPAALASLTRVAEVMWG